MKCWKLSHLCIIMPDFDKQTSFPLIYVCIYKCSFMFVQLFLYIIIHLEGYGVSKRYLMDVTCGMGSKTCQNRISILMNSPWDIPSLWNSELSERPISILKFEILNCQREGIQIIYLWKVFWCVMGVGLWWSVWLSIIVSVQVLSFERLNWNFEIDLGLVLELDNSVLC